MYVRSPHLRARHPLGGPPDCIGHLVGRQGNNIQRLGRQLELTKLSIATRGGSEYLRTEAATPAIVSNAQSALADEVHRILRQTPGKRA